MTRKELSKKALPNVQSYLLHRHANIADNMLFPVVAKPKEGVASLDVRRCNTYNDLKDYCDDFWQKSPHAPILVEQFIQGPLITLETLGDGKHLVAVGDFDVELSQPAMIASIPS